jgi:hypothetical protein
LQNSLAYRDTQDDNAATCQSATCSLEPDRGSVLESAFSPAFGAFLHARNADATGRVDEAKANRVWFYVSIAYLGFTIVAVFLPAIPEGLFRLTAIGLPIGWYFSLGRKQIRYVKETWQDRYTRKPWQKPLLIAFCCLIGISIVLEVAGKLVLGSQ